jgi:circadian clock protein KaiB
MPDRKKNKKKGFVLTLYIASMNARARFAIENIRRFCEEHLEEGYELEVIDLRENPSLTIEEKIVATPVLIKRLPPPIRTFIGNMRNMEKILVGMDLKRKEGEEEAIPNNTDREGA